MDESGSRHHATGLCWYCGRTRGGAASLALGFWSQVDDEVRVLVLPRCDACAELHERQRLPGGLIMVAGAATGAIPASLLPLAEPWRGVAIIGALITGFVVAYLCVADREAKHARRQGSRPLADYVRHPPYHALASDTARWRQDHRRTGIGEGSHRRDTVYEMARHFTSIAKRPEVITALARGCSEAGVPWPPAGVITLSG